MGRGSFEGEKGRPIVKCKDILRVNFAKTAEPINILFGLWAPMGPRNHVLDMGPDPPWEGVILRGKGRPIVKYNDTLS